MSCVKVVDEVCVVYPDTSLVKKRNSPPSLPDKHKSSKDSVVVSVDDKHEKTQQEKEKEEEEKEEATASKKKRKKKKKKSSQSSSDPCELSTEKKDKGGGDKDVVDKELKKDIDKDTNKVGDNDVNKQAAGVSKRRVKTEPAGAEELKRTKTKMKMVVDGSDGGAIDRAIADKESVRREHANTENDSDISYCSSPNSTTESISSVGGAEPVSTEDGASVDKDTMISKEDAVAKKSDIVNKEATVEKEESAVAKEVDVRKKKRVHTCAFCGLGETMTKSFKRCQK